MKVNQDDKILISKIIDKINFSKTKNKITNSQFLNEYQIAMIEKELKKIKETNYFFEGGDKNSESKILIAYPENLDIEIVYENVKNIIKAIKIELPNEIQGKFQHRNYLGTVMKFGLERDRIGDIIVYKDLAYIIVLKENAEYIKNSFEFENQFKKAKISIININEVKYKKIEFENIEITVTSVRLDNIISELLNTSRNVAQKLINEEKVSINYNIETKNIKRAKESDILIVRGNGKYIIDKFLGKNKKNKEIIKIKKYK